MNLSQLKRGDWAKIIKLENDKRTANRLNDMGIIEGVNVKLIRFASFGDPLLIKVRDFVLAIRKDDAQKIMVEKL